MPKFRTEEFKVYRFDNTFKTVDIPMPLVHVSVQVISGDEIIRTTSILQGDEGPYAFCMLIDASSDEERYISYYDGGYEVPLCMLGKWVLRTSSREWMRYLRTELPPETYKNRFMDVKYNDRFAETLRKHRKNGFTKPQVSEAL